ncbi:hypothetical protein AWB98_10865 [Mycolicibacterium conceptionense]|uniref:Uncharacterized protein n=1 Tax=Mycolicibacterium conceptionense TaxID=451644 RepID=A0ABX3V9G1_9MYCO|nr:hypothetical protein AWB98_10865 [Mycolicibacterium conceptionense]
MVSGRRRFGRFGLSTQARSQAVKELFVGQIRLICYCLRCAFSLIAIRAILLRIIKKIGDFFVLERDVISDCFFR